MSNEPGAKHDTLFSYSIDAAPIKPHDAQASVLFVLEQMTFSVMDTGLFPSLDDIPDGYVVKVEVGIVRYDETQT